MSVIYSAPKAAFMNREDVFNSTKVGCYHCLQIFNPKDVKQYTDGGKTALCPFCEVDSLVCTACGYDVTPNILKEIKNYWFG